MLFFCLDHISYKILKKHQQWFEGSRQWTLATTLKSPTTLSLPFPLLLRQSVIHISETRIAFSKNNFCFSGELRFSKPQPATPWSEPRNATQAGAPVHPLTVCYQVQSRSLRLFHRASLWSPFPNSVWDFHCCAGRRSDPILFGGLSLSLGSCASHPG